MFDRLPEDHAARPLREQIRALEDCGLRPARARLVVLYDLGRAAVREVEHIWREYRGKLRETKQQAASFYWFEFWAVLRQEIETGHDEDVVRLIDDAVDRVEPAGAPAAGGAPR